MNNNNPIIYKNSLETLVSLFTIDNGEIKVLLRKKKTEPYKGYWILPGDALKEAETFESCVNKVIYDKTGINNLHIEQCNTYSPLERRLGEKLVAISYMGLVDITTILIKQEEKATEEFGWFNISCLPKIGYDHKKIIENAIERLRGKFINFEVLKILFPSDFTLTEIQKSFEQILNKKFDRRNFRKKFMQLDLITETGETTEGSSGRPAKLYQFKNEDIVRELF